VNSGSSKKTTPRGSSLDGGGGGDRGNKLSDDDVVVLVGPGERDDETTSSSSDGVRAGACGAFTLFGKRVFGKRCGLRSLLPLFIVSLFVLAAILLGVFVYRNLHASELSRFQDRLALLCQERQRAFQGIVGQATQSMQGAAGFGRLAQRSLYDGAVIAPVGTGAFPISDFTAGTQKLAESVAYANKSILPVSLKLSDFLDYFQSSASPRYTKQILWMPMIRNASRADWQNRTGITIKQVCATHNVHKGI
jgi:hypothetical protein